MIFAATGSNDALHIGLVLTAFGFGFRHGIDWDHIAALTDITGSQPTSRRSMRVASLYALGHALVVFGLGIGAIVFARELPASVDAVMERFVGLTLLALGVFVVVSLLRNGRRFRMRSRWMVLFAGIRRCRNALRRTAPIIIEHDHEHVTDAVHAHVHTYANAVATPVASPLCGGEPVHRHRHRHIGELPDDPFITASGGSAFAIGMLHGIGAETPTQILIFLAAATAGGKGAGLVLLGCFLIGLLCSNTAVALATTLGFRSTTKNYAVYATVSAVAAAFSLVVGTIFVFGHGAALPSMLGG